MKEQNKAKDLIVFISKRNIYTLVLCILFTPILSFVTYQMVFHSKLSILNWMMAILFIILILLSFYLFFDALGMAKLTPHHLILNPFILPSKKIPLNSINSITVHIIEKGGAIYKIAGIRYRQQNKEKKIQFLNTSISNFEAFLAETSRLSKVKITDYTTKLQSFG